MDQDLFKNLPSHITIDILARLNVQSITLCKCVCKSWLDLFKNQEFINHHLSKSPPGLAVFQGHPTKPDSFKIYEFEDVSDHHHHHLRYNLVSSFKIPHPGFLLQGSANGLLFLLDQNSRPNAPCICNPITREYIRVHSPEELSHPHYLEASFGFGSSRISGQYKVVRIPQRREGRVVAIFDCHVYTLGTGSWRSVEAPFMYDFCYTGAFLNGNLYWLVFDSDKSPRISCFDLETEVFSFIDFPPPLLHHNDFTLVGGVFALEGCLCVCDNSSEDEIVAWLMREYREEKSWTKEFVIEKPDFVVSNYDSGDVVRLIKVFKDGEILMAWGDFFLFYSSGKRRTMAVIKMFEAHRFGWIVSILHSSSFLSLKSYEMEIVHSL